MIPDEFWQEIEHFQEKIILVSGGVDSTYIAREFHKRNIPSTLLFNNTGLVLQSSFETLTKLFKEYEFTITYPKEVHEVLKKSFEMLDDLNKDNYNKKKFDCCRKLKHDPTRIYLKKIGFDGLIISGIAPYENTQRRIFLAQLKKRDTFLHYHTSKKIWYAYPLRDFHKEITIDGVKHSGCSVCPILLLFRMIKEEPERYLKSKKYYIKMIGGRFCSKLDQSLDDFQLFS